MTEPIKRRPKWLRFSLRTLLVVMTVLCVWLGWKVNAARRQKDAVEAITKAGGDVVFDYQIALNPPGTPALFKVLPNALPPEPDWLRATIGDDYFRKVVAVNLQLRNGQPSIAESDLKRLTNLPDLIDVGLVRVRVVSDGSNLQRQINDADLETVGQLSRLRMLVVDHTDISGSGLSHLAKRKDLKFLNLSVTPITALEWNLSLNFRCLKNCTYTTLWLRMKGSSTWSDWST